VLLGCAAAGFLMLAAVRLLGIPGGAVLVVLAGHVWGVALLVLIAVTLAVFALYSLIEARYRDITRGV
jgi:uncharacterized membrane protein YdjX (TVP38/TMEM64 family)